MRRVRNRLLPALLLVAFGLEALRAEGPPHLAVPVVVDRLRADCLERFGDRYRGGFRWPLGRGPRFPGAAYRHSVTVTAAGNAAISTGLHPSTHGIAGNSWREAGRGSVCCVQDESYHPVGGPGKGRSAGSLLADAVGARRVGLCVGGETGTGDGTAHPHDRPAPVLLAGAGVLAGVCGRPAGPPDIAPTLGTILGFEMSLEPDTRVLREAPAGTSL